MRTNIDTIAIIFELTGILGSCLLKTSNEMKYIIAYKISIVETYTSGLNANAL